MKLDTLTISQIHSWRPCNMAAGESYSRANLRKLFGGNSIVVTDVLKLPIPLADRLWVVLRSEVLDDRELRLLACLFAEHVLPLFEQVFPDDNRLRECIRVSREFANGIATKSQLNAAWSTALAARDAAGAAARAAEAAEATTLAAGFAAWAAGAAEAAEATTLAAGFATWAAGAAGAAARAAAKAAAWAAGAAAWDAGGAGAAARAAARAAAWAAGAAAWDAGGAAEGEWQCSAALAFLKT